MPQPAMLSMLQVQKYVRWRDTGSIAHRADAFTPPVPSTRTHRSHLPAKHMPLRPGSPLRLRVLHRHALEENGATKRRAPPGSKPTCNRSGAAPDMPGATTHAIKGTRDCQTWQTRIYKAKSVDASSSRRGQCSRSSTRPPLPGHQAVAQRQVIRLPIHYTDIAA